MDDNIEKFKMSNGVSFPPLARFAVELVTLGVMLGGLYYALSGRIDIMSERLEGLRAAHVRMEQSVKDIMSEHDKRIDQIEQGTAPIVTDMKDQIKELKRSKQSKRGE